MDCSVTSFSELVGLIYEAALDSPRWDDATDLLRSQLSFATATLSLVAMPDGRSMVQVARGIPQPWMSRIPEYDRDVLDLWGGAEFAQQFPIDRVAVVSRVNPRALAPQSMNRYVREWGEPQGLVDSMAIIMARDASAIGTLAMGRHRDAGPISEQEITYAELLIPHLQRAAAISRMLDVQRGASGVFASVIDGLATPVIVLGADRTVLHANGASQALLESDSGLVVRAGILSANRTDVTRALAAAVSTCASVIDTKGRARHVDLSAGGVIPVRNGRGGYALHVLPLTGGSLRFGMPGAVAAVLGTRAEGATHPGTVVAALFGLTPAEARVFDCVSRGRSRAETAAELGVAPSTVQTHLLRIFEKVGVNRQVELVRLAATLASPLGAAR